VTNRRHLGAHPVPMVFRLTSALVKLLATLLLAGLLGATMVRLAPGFDLDEKVLDPRFSEESKQAQRDAHGSAANILTFYRRYIGGMARGDLGVSRTFERPVAELLAERLPVTIASASAGLAFAWSLALAAASCSVLFRSPYFDVAVNGFSIVLLCLPAALLGLVFLLLRAPIAGAFAAVIFPKVFRYAQDLLGSSSALPHVITAQAKGLRPERILVWHTAPSVAPQLLALAGVSISLAMGSAVPIEVLCDSPGIGQLAWRAAMGRDLPLLISLTLVMTAVTVTANAVSDFVASGLRGTL